MAIKVCFGGSLSTNLGQIARLEKLVVEEKKRAKETVNVNKGLLVKGGRILHHLKAFLKGRTS